MPPAAKIAPVDLSAGHLEHANVTVRAIEPALAFLQAALPHWRVRGEGRMDWHGKRIRWLHVGTDDHYLALQDQGEGPAPEAAGHALGVKHLGFAVPDLAALQQRLAAAGHQPDHHADAHPHRLRSYYRPDALLEVEFVQYLSDRPEERHAYPAN